MRRQVSATTGEADGAGAAAPRDSGAGARAPLRPIEPNPIALPCRSAVACNCTAGRPDETNRGPADNTYLPGNSITSILRMQTLLPGSCC
jgi:hypothetical protein